MNKTYSLSFNNKTIYYELKKSHKRRKNITLKINPKGTVIIYAPSLFTHKEAKQTILDKINWIWKHLNQFQNKANNLTKLLHEGLFLYQGQVIDIKISIDTNRKKTSFSVINNYFDIKLNNIHNISTELLKELKKLAKIKITQRIYEISNKINIKFNRLTIKDTKSRWGSCSTLKNINLSWRLIMAPPAILDYVIIHELCHIIEPNHSKKYWNVVQSFVSDYKEKRIWLKEWGWILYTI